MASVVLVSKAEPLCSQTAGRYDTALHSAVSALLIVESVVIAGSTSEGGVYALGGWKSGNSNWMLLADDS